MAFERYQTEVTIDGVDVSADLLKYKATKSVSETSIGECEVIVKKSVYTTHPSLDNTQEIIIKRGTSSPTTKTIFRGTVEVIEEAGGQVKLTGKDKLYQLVKAEVNKVYFDTDSEAGVISEIIKDLITTFGGLNADANTIQNSGTAITLEKFVCQRADVFERVTSLAESLDWLVYYNPSDDKVYLEPKTHNSNANILKVSSTGNVYEVPKWQFDSAQLIQQVTVIGQESLVEKTEEFDGDGATATFTLTKVPESMRVTVDGTEQTGGVDNSTDSPDYTVDKENKQITFQTGSIPASGTNNIDVIYSYIEPVIAILDDPTSIAAYGYVDKDGNRQPFARTFELKDVRTIEDAENRGIRIIEAFANPLVTVPVKVRNIDAFNADINQSIRIDDDVNDEDRVLLIRQIAYHYPSKYDEIILGDYYFQVEDLLYTTSERVRRLEEQGQRNEGTVTRIKKVSANVRYVNRYTIIDDYAINDSFVLDHSVNGELDGAFKLDDQSTLTDTFAIIPSTDSGVHKYEEFFYDTDFRDAGNTTAIWGSSQLTFTSGQIATSSAIMKGAGTITKATMTITKSSGTYTLEMSADGGSNYETVTSGTEKTFTNSGTELLWRITESAGSTGTITKIQIEVTGVS